MRSDNEKLPTENDVEKSSESLIRLMHVYQVPIDELMSHNLLEKSSMPLLSSKLNQFHLYFS